MALFQREHLRKQLASVAGKKPSGHIISSRGMGRRQWRQPLNKMPERSTNVCERSGIIQRRLKVAKRSGIVSPIWWKLGDITILGQTSRRLSQSFLLLVAP